MKLKDYQEEGVNWLSSMSHALLADDMGLGKTVQVISACNKLAIKNTLVVCPAAARVNWQREFDTWSLYTTLTVHTALKSKPTENMVCSYGYMAANKAKLAKIEWDLIVFDESHFLKAPKTKRTKAAYGKSGLVRASKRVWLLSGTPAPNDPSELWTMLYTFGITNLPYMNFVERYCNTYDNGYGLSITGTKQEMLPELKELLKRVMVRRKKEDVISLPPISFKNVYVEPGKVEVRLEDKEELFKQEAMANVTEGESLLAMADSVSTLRRYTGLQKVEPAIELIKKLLKTNEKVVVFAIHRQIVQTIFNELTEYVPVTLNGSTTPQKRQKNIDSFQNDDKCRVFIGNILAAGTAITLTAANQVVFLEQDWVPGNNAQAAMRCHRIGQTKHVTVHVISIKDSFDASVSTILTRKIKDLTQLFDN